jgi:hypothetical protein
MKDKALLKVISSEPDLHDELLASGARKLKAV